MSKSVPQVKGMAELLATLRAIPQKVTAVVAAELQDGANSIAAEAKQRAPGDQGLLRNLISVNKIDALHYEVISGASYSAFVEFGTLEKVDVPAELQEYASQFQGAAIGSGELSFKEAIFEWCRRQGIDEKFWYAIYISIATHGVAPQPFFFPAAKHLTPVIIGRVKKALENL